MFKLKNIELNIKWKLFAYFSLFSLIMLLLLWLFQIVFLNNFYEAIKVKELYDTSKAILSELDSDDISDTIEKLSHNKDICIILYKNSNVAYTSNVLMNCVIHRMPSYLLYPIVSSELAENDEYFSKLSPERKDNNPFISGNKKNFADSVILAKKIYSKNNEEFILVLNSVIEPVYSTTSTLRSQLICITVIMITLSFILSLIISKKIAHPIENINSSAKKLPFEYNLKFEDSGYKEISELANTLTYVSSELSKVENLRRELIANISHDLRTPLTMITGYSEVIRDIPGENTPENIQVIIDESKRLTGLVNDLLDISKLQNGKMELNKEKFNLTKCIESILTRYTKLIEKDGYSIKFEKDTEVEIEADELKITQVIYNLINNAITYTGEDKSITIRQSVADGNVKIEIIDTGDGINEDEIQYIWDRYYKAKGNHKRAKVGTGLGLAIVKNVLQLHGAVFGVNNNPEKGANFWFVLKYSK